MNDVFRSASFEDQVFENLESPGVDLSHKEFTRCTFRRCRLQDSQWLGSQLEDCVFEHCDLSNFRPKALTLRGVQFSNCKLIGVDWSNTIAFPVFGFTDCLMRYQSFAGCKLKKTEFVRCLLTECTFVDADLSKAKFSECDLAQTTFERCDLTQVRLETSRAAFFDPQKNKIKGARISLETAALIATAAGMIVEQ